MFNITSVKCDFSEPTRRYGSSSDATAEKFAHR